jgi:hypothetical protein
MLKLNTGISKKIGLPGFSSASASCTIEAELDGSLLNDSDGFQVVVKRAYQSCEKAVQDEISRLTGTHDGLHDSNESTSQPQAVVQEIVESALAQPSVASLSPPVPRLRAPRARPALVPRQPYRSGRARTASSDSCPTRYGLIRHSADATQIKRRLHRVDLRHRNFYERDTRQARPTDNLAMRRCASVTELSEAKFQSVLGTGRAQIVDTRARK